MADRWGYESRYGRENRRSYGEYGRESDRSRGQGGNYGGDYGRYQDRDSGASGRGYSGGGGDFQGGSFGRDEDYDRGAGGRYDRGSRGTSWGGGDYGREGYGGTGWSGGSYGSDYDEYDRGDGGRYGYGAGGYGASYGRGGSRGNYGSSRYGNDYGGDYSRGGSYGGDQDRGWLDRAGDTVRSWFGDESADQRLRMDEHRGRGPKGYTRSDDRIREDVCDRLSDDPRVDASEIEVSVTSGEVQLSGTVGDRQSKRLAEDCVEDVSGVKHVQNNLRVSTSGSTSMLGDSDTSSSLSGGRALGGAKSNI